MHTLFMIEMSVRKTMPTSDGFWHFFCCNQTIFHQRKASYHVHQSDSSQTWSFRQALRENIQIRIREPIDQKSHRTWEPIE